MTDEREDAMTVETLESYLGGRWSRGQGVETELIDPTQGHVLATASAKGVDREPGETQPNRTPRRASSSIIRSAQS